MKDKSILLVGGGGHCKSVLDTLVALRQYEKIGIVERKNNRKNEVLGIPVVGTDEELSSLLASGYESAFITVGSVGDPRQRIKLFNMIIKVGFSIPNIIDATAIVSKNVKLDTGIFVAKGVIINAGARIESSCILNSGCIIEHDCSIGAFSHIAPGAVLCGNVTIGDNTHIGANSVIRQGLKIGSNVIIGAGAVVINDVPDYCTAVGNPATVTTATDPQ